MATPAINPYNKYQGNGSTVEFSIDFPYLDRSFIKVYVKRAGGLQTVIPSSDYSFSNDKTIRFPATGSQETVLAVGDVMTIQRETPVESDYEFTNQKRLFPEDVMNADDLSFQILQEQARELGRAIKVDPTSDTDPQELVNKVERIHDSIDNIDTTAAHIGNIDAVAGDIENIDVVASISADITDCAEIKEDITTVSANIAEVVSVSEDIEDVVKVGQNIEKVKAVADNETNINAVNANKTNIDTAVANMAAILDAPVQAAAAANSATAADGSATLASNHATAASNSAFAAAGSAQLAGYAATGTLAQYPAGSAKYWAEQAAQGQIQSDWAQSDTTKKDYIKHKPISNCLTHIPQDIKLELNNGTLTLKSGSKVYVPNGANTFTPLEINSDISLSLSTSANNKYFLFGSAGTSGSSIVSVYRQKIQNSTSGSVVPSSGVFYDTTNNKITTVTGGVQDTTFLSFPLCCFSTDSNNVITSIDQVFNGFGYIGSTVFALPGVKGLIPNGRNADGTLKNTETTTNRVLTYTSTDTPSGNYYIQFRGNFISRAYAYPSSWRYDEERNIILWNNIAEQAVLFAGNLVLSSGRVESIIPKTAFHAVDYNDYYKTVEQVNYNSNELTTKQDIATALNYNNISNCITHISQDIKLELNAGTLTLKAGSKVYVPKGAGVFDVKNITRDFDCVMGAQNTQVLIALEANEAQLSMRNIQNCVSGSGVVTTSGFAYDTLENKLYYCGSSGVRGSVHSLPIAICTVDNEKVVSIDQVFNGFGYIGSTVFALPGVKGLVPNGRNTDGSLKNTEFTITSVKTQQVSYTGYIEVDSTGIGIYGKDATKYIEDINLNFDIYAGNTFLRCNCGVVFYTSGQITSFQPKTAFHALDYNDGAFVKEESLTECGVITESYRNGTSGYDLYSNGDVVQWGFALRTAATQDVTLLVEMADTNYNILLTLRHTADSTDGRPPLIRTITTEKFVANIYTTYEGFYWFVKGKAKQ